MAHHRQFEDLRARLTRVHETHASLIGSQERRALGELQASSQRSREDAATRYAESVSKIQHELDAELRHAGSAGRAWDHPDWDRYEPAHARTAPAQVRFGEYAAENAFGTLAIPLIAPIIGGRHVLIQAQDAAKDAGLELMQSLMLRLLAHTQAGKLRFTLIDPVGLGSNVGGFLNLPDDITGGKAWTEPSHIEQQMADISDHMAMVIQKFLRDRHTSIVEYNDEAEEIAEPYRLLAVANFPSGFDERSANRLLSIIANGPRTGVYALIMLDTGHALPEGFQLDELRRQSTIVNVGTSGSTFAPSSELPCGIKIDRLPPLRLSERIVVSTAEAYSSRPNVEVPFERIVPDQDAWWSEDTRETLAAPIGRLGARDTQSLEFGRGTQQHGIVAGRTGSGKSNLLHVLILSLAARYSPRELMLYLVDFKKGVEFQCYATHRLPHARVVAIQSERELGLSVLRELDQEIQRRGDAFKSVEATSLAGYRTEAPDGFMPRILLVVDEFHEFFVENDGVANEAGMLLDRLVKQGRAFGMHALLASQALSGMAALMSSTLSQMAVRIALQCSEADSRFILGEDNPAARLLTRPGEAYYNAANGAIEGNALFQVAWLSEDVREKSLQRIHAHAERTNSMPPYDLFVFEGSGPADLRENKALEAALRSTWQDETTAPSAWLGVPTAIRPPVAATFRRQSRANLAILGHNEPSAAALLHVVTAALAAQASPAAAEFYFLNLTDPDTAWSLATQALGESLPHQFQVGGTRDVAEFVGVVGTRVAERLDTERDEDVGPAVYLLILGIQRSRELRPAERYTPSDASEQLLSVLQDGPEVGVHTLVWGDTYAGLERALQREGIDEFDMRVALATNPDDSSSFIGTPDASRLDRVSALFHDEERGGMAEKFRPYGLPPTEWGRAVGHMLSTRL